MEKASLPQDKPQSTPSLTDAADLIREGVRFQETLIRTLAEYDFFKISTGISSPNLLITLSGTAVNSLGLPKRFEGSPEHANRFVIERCLDVLHGLIGYMPIPELIAFLPILSDEIIEKLISRFDNLSEQDAFITKMDSLIGKNAISPLEKLPTSRDILKRYLEMLNEAARS